MLTAVKVIKSMHESNFCVLCLVFDVSLLLLNFVGSQKNAEKIDACKNYAHITRH